VGHRLAAGPLHQEEALLRLLPGKKGKESPVLVAQADLQVQDLFPKNAEAEVPRLNDPRVHRPHGNLVEIGEEAEGVGQVVAAEGLERGVPLRHQAVPLP
jgi:hypothetical protein